ncbi:MAG: nucleotidyltransferase domain-containing protein [Candidatus Lokiarchaeota archaeon]|nr:nucleotidyltransferase domain-containing protein [Candidatus Lokiarchaeota archaeon]
MKTDRWITSFKVTALPKLLETFKPVKILLFGSRAKGTATEDSDLDIIIVSDFFEPIPFLERMPIVLKLIAFPKHVDIICYSEKEFLNLKNKSSILIDALKHGIELHATS